MMDGLPSVSGAIFLECCFCSYACDRIRRFSVNNAFPSEVPLETSDLALHDSDLGLTIPHPLLLFASTHHQDHQHANSQCAASPALLVSKSATPFSSNARPLQTHLIIKTPRTARNHHPPPDSATHSA